jgi:hypothetical protein
MGTTSSISSGGGAIGVSATGDETLALIDAGTGNISLNAGGGIKSALIGHATNLIGGSATIVAGGDAIFSTSISSDSLNTTGVKGHNAITDPSGYPIGGGIPVSDPAQYSGTPSTGIQSSTPSVANSAGSNGATGDTSGSSGSNGTGSSGDTIGNAKDSFGSSDNGQSDDKKKDDKTKDSTNRDSGNGKDDSKDKSHAKPEKC